MRSWEDLAATMQQGTKLHRCGGGAMTTKNERKPGASQKQATGAMSEA